MTNLRQTRVLHMTQSATGMLKRAQEEAEALQDQTMAEDLQVLVLAADRVLRAAERRRYVRQLAELGQLQMCVSEI